MKTTILSIAILLLSSAIFAQSNYSQETLDKIKEVENNITGNLIVNDAPPNTILERMAKYKVKGLSIAVIQDYKIAWAKGYGWADEAEKRPVTPKTLFEPGSISKTLNALGILKLAQDKKLDLYTDINTYLKSWKFPYDSLSKGKKITLANLLSHTAGLSTHGFPGHNINGPTPTVFEVLDGKAPAVTPAVAPTVAGVPTAPVPLPGWGAAVAAVLFFLGLTSPVLMGTSSLNGRPARFNTIVRSIPGATSLSGKLSALPGTMPCKRPSSSCSNF